MLFDSIHQEISDSTMAELGKIYPAISKDILLEISLETPPEPDHGDFAFPVFKLAKVLRTAPKEIAAKLAQSLQQHANLTKRYEILVSGAYVNFKVKNEILFSEILSELLLSSSQLSEKKQPGLPTVVLEFSSPNVAKPFNIYHLRSTMIGECLRRTYSARGYNVVAINHLGDWGTQFGALTIAFQKWGNDLELDQKGIPYLVDLYVRIHKEMETDQAITEQARAAFAKLEKHDPEISKIWKKFVDLSLKEFQSTYKRLGVYFDHYWGESTYVDKITDLEEKLKAANLLVESEGAQVVLLEGMPACIIRKADGSSIYATRDLAAAIFRYEKFKFSKMLYVAGVEQKLHFAQFFKVLERMGYAWAKNCIHVDFGLYRFKDTKMSTRKGNFVTMEYVLDEAVHRVDQMMTKRQPEMSQDERKQAAEVIGVGAVIFNDLATDRATDVQFDLNRVLDFEGETGPYIQYAHTRCLSILRNAPPKLLTGINIEQLLDLNAPQPGLKALLLEASKTVKEKEELHLIRQLARMPLALDFVLENARPSILANYLIDVTKVFNAFYREHKVLVEDTHLALGRLALVLATQRVLLKGLYLLGIGVPARM